VRRIAGRLDIFLENKAISQKISAFMQKTLDCKVTLPCMIILKNEKQVSCGGRA